MILQTSCTSLSVNVGMPSGRFFPLLLGMYTLRVGLGRYVPLLS